MSKRAMLASGIVGPALFVSVFLVEGALRPDYDALRMQVSLLSLGDRGPIQIGSFLVSGTLVMLFALGLRSSLSGGRGAGSAPIAIAVVGLGMVVAGMFSVQPSFGYPPGAPKGIGGDVAGQSYLHLLGAFLFVFGMVAAAGILAVRFRATGNRGWAAWSAATALVVVVFFGASSGGPDGMPFVPAYAGLFQRMSIIAGLAWIASLAAGILIGTIEAATQASSDR